MKITLNKKNFNILINIIEEQIRINNFILCVKNSDLFVFDEEFDIKVEEESYKKIFLETDNLKRIHNILLKYKNVK